MKENREGSEGGIRMGVKKVRSKKMEDVKNKRERRDIYFLELKGGQGI